MTTSALTPGTTTAPSARYAVSVRRARGLLRFMLTALVVTGLLSTLISFIAAQDALSRYRQIVADSAVSADAAQAARASVLAHHSAAADYLSQQGTPEADAALTRSQQAWREYQESLRGLWENRSDERYGEFAVFESADSATLRYRAGIDAMIAFNGAGNVEAAQDAFLNSHQILVQELVPALNGLESVKLESMEEAYATTNETVTAWQRVLLAVGGASVLLLLLGFFLTRYWLHYAWTWELALAALVGLLLFAWFNLSLLYAANRVEVLVRDAYDTVSGIQSVEALLTQVEALESMAIFNPEQAPAFLSDAEEYLQQAEQQLCGEFSPHCTSTPFLSGNRISPQVAEAAISGQSKYGLPRAPLVAFANDRFAGEPEALEALRAAMEQYIAANIVLSNEVAVGEPLGATQSPLSTEAYVAALDAAAREQTVARQEFNGIYDRVTTSMEVNRWLALLFTGLAALGFWGLRRRREALFP